MTAWCVPPERNTHLTGFGRRVEASFRLLAPAHTGNPGQGRRRWLLTRLDPFAFRLVRTESGLTAVAPGFGG